MAPRRKADGGGKAPAGPPPLLARLYGDGNVLCLRELLLRLGAASHEAAALPAALVQPHDHADYSQVRPAIDQRYPSPCLGGLFQPPNGEAEGAVCQAAAETAAALHDGLGTLLPTAGLAGAHLVCVAAWCSCAEGWLLPVPGRQPAAGGQGPVDAAVAPEIAMPLQAVAFCGLHFAPNQPTDSCTHGPP